MTTVENLKQYVTELTKKHRALDEKIIQLEKRLYVDQEVRSLKTQKLFYKDELHRIQNKIDAMENGVNGS
ncbi:YdcH family protein [bacterium]|jgi:uncharacterized protein YdcH (DUF465 family)|nr:YdcH family protein [bacterium]